MPDSIRVLVALPVPVPPEYVQPVQAISPRLHVEICQVNSLGEVSGQLSTAEILVTSLGLPGADQAPKLRWVQSYSAGVDGWLPSAQGRLNEVALTTASGVHAPVMAEYSLLMMLAFAHVLPELLAYQQRREWPANRFAILKQGELRGTTLGVVGYGSIGRETSRQACALGMRILACKRSPAQRKDTGWSPPGTGDARGELPERFYGLEQLRDMLPECDYVLLTPALTAATRHIIDAEALQCMRPSAVLINVARGGLVDEPALVEALRSGVIRGAGLDVFEKEPLPAESPLWSLPNVLLTPHMAGITPAYEERLMVLFAENLRRYLAGQPLLNRVDPQAGY